MRRSSPSAPGPGGSEGCSASPAPITVSLAGAWSTRAPKAVSRKGRPLRSSGRPTKRIRNSSLARLRAVRSAADVDPVGDDLVVTAEPAPARPLGRLGDGDPCRELVDHAPGSEQVGGVVGDRLGRVGVEGADHRSLGVKRRVPPDQRRDRLVDVDHVETRPGESRGGLRSPPPGRARGWRRRRWRRSRRCGRPGSGSPGVSLGSTGARWRALLRRSGGSTGAITLTWSPRPINSSARASTCRFTPPLKLHEYGETRAIRTCLRVVDVPVADCDGAHASKARAGPKKTPQQGVRLPVLLRLYSCPGAGFRPLGPDVAAEGQQVGGADLEQERPGVVGESADCGRRGGAGEAGRQRRGAIEPRTRTRRRCRTTAAIVASRAQKTGVAAARPKLIAESRRRRSATSARSPKPPASSTERVRWAFAAGDEVDQRQQRQAPGSAPRAPARQASGAR